jgi:hypothetical protein
MEFSEISTPLDLLEHIKLAHQYRVSEVSLREEYRYYIEKLWSTQLPSFQQPLSSDELTDKHQELLENECSIIEIPEELLSQLSQHLKRLRAITVPEHQFVGSCIVPAELGGCYVFDVSVDSITSEPENRCFSGYFAYSSDQECLTVEPLFVCNSTNPLAGLDIASSHTGIIESSFCIKYNMDEISFFIKLLLLDIHNLNHNSFDALVDCILAVSKKLSIIWLLSLEASVEDKEDEESIIVKKAIQQVLQEGCIDTPISSIRARIKRVLEMHEYIATPIDILERSNEALRLTNYLDTLLDTEKLDTLENARNYHFNNSDVASIRTLGLHILNLLNSISLGESQATASHSITKLYYSDHQQVIQEILS